MSDAVAVGHAKSDQSKDTQFGVEDFIALGIGARFGKQQRIEVVDKLREKCNEGFIEIEEESSLFFMKKLVALKLRAELVVFLGFR